jgi:hypothetical protein
VGNGLDPAGHQALVDEAGAEEGQRQRHELDGRDDRLLLAQDQAEPDRQRREGKADQRGDRDQHGDAGRAAVEARARRQTERDDDHGLGQRDDPLVGEHPAGDRAAPDRGHQQAVGDAAVKVAEHPHAGPAAGEQRGHHHHARRQEGDVGGRAEARDLGDALEELTEEQQPHDRLHQADGDQPRLA